jgi:hypothetical protein
MVFRKLLRSIFDPIVILGSLGCGVTLVTSLMLIVWLTRPVPAAPGLPTAALTVISLPTATPPLPTPTPEQPVTPTIPPLPEPPAGEFAIGAYVQIAGTGGDGLRLRVEPGLDSNVRLLGVEAEVFQVKDGPREVDSYLWWYLVAPFDETHSGWAVSNYLKVVQNP